MLFHTATFAIFFAVVFAAYALLARWLFLQNLLLIAASYVFYGWWDARFLSLIAISTATDYIAGLGTAGERVGRVEYGKVVFAFALLSAALLTLGVKDALPIAAAMMAFCLVMIAYAWAVQTFAAANARKLFLAFSVAVNLGILGFFKYFNFFAESLADLLGNFGVTLDYVTLNIILPVGLSFYTFQTMSYTIDSYRGVLQPTRRLTDITAFVTFFPQLVAGPIERAADLLPQFSRPRSITWENLKSAAMLFLWGVFKKVVVADNVAPISDHMFANYTTATGGELLIGAVAFSFQIYCDFSAYSDMARAVGRAMGFELSLNFNLPYFSRSPSEFWRRWHISLSSWLRDYLYIPLGGNRFGAFATYRNLIVTMTLGGLWHGASWTFVIWGLFHGTILALYRAAGIDRMLAVANHRTSGGIIVHGVALVVMLYLTLIGWIIFRATDMHQVVTIVAGLRWPSATDTGGGPLLFYITPIVLVQIYQRYTGNLEFISASKGFVRLNIVLFLLMSIVFLASNRTEEFIYFDF